MDNGVKKGGMLRPRTANTKRVSKATKPVADSGVKKAGRARTSSTSDKPVTYAEARAALKRMMRSGM